MIWALEPDFVQYTEGTQSSALSMADAKSLLSDIIDVIVIVIIIIELTVVCLQPVMSHQSNRLPVHSQIPVAQPVDGKEVLPK